MVTTSDLGYASAELAARGAGHTAREIAQQPALWRAVARQARQRRQQSETFLRPLIDRPDMRVVLTGAGSSAMIGEVLAPVLSLELGRRVEAVATTDLVANPRESFAGDRPTLLVSFARSGDSPESVAAVTLAEQCLTELHHLVVTCHRDGELHGRFAGDDGSLLLLLPAESNDVGFAMTSSFTCMLLAARLTLGRTVPGEQLVGRLAEAAEQVLDNGSRLARSLAGRGYHRIVYLGSGPLTGLARESALKVLELTAGAVVSTADSALGFRHGPKSVLDADTLVVVHASNDPYTRQYDDDIVAELRRALPPRDVVAVMARSGDDRPDDHALWLPGLDDVDDAALALPFAVFAQLIGLHFSLTAGRTPDNPFPDGEVNRVVRGVSIHPLTP